MRTNVPLSRAVVAGLLVVAVSGCGWFRNTNELYAGAPENRPLEVPPDLDMPRTGTDAPTGSASASETIAAASATTAANTPADGVSAAPVPPVAPAAAATGFTIPGTRDEAFAKVDTALAAIEGVSVASRAALLGVFDVNYRDVNFLVRVSEAEGGAYVSAVDPRGMPATSEAATQLITQLQAALGAN